MLAWSGCVGCAALFVEWLGGVGCGQGLGREEDSSRRLAWALRLVCTEREGKQPSLQWAGWHAWRSAVAWLAAPHGSQPGLATAGDSKVASPAARSCQLQIMHFLPLPCHPHLAADPASRLPFFAQFPAPRAAPQAAVCSASWAAYASWCRYRAAIVLMYCTAVLPCCASSLPAVPGCALPCCTLLLTWHQFMYCSGCGTRWTSRQRRALPLEHLPRHQPPQPPPAWPQALQPVLPPLAAARPCLQRAGSRRRSSLQPQPSRRRRRCPTAAACCSSRCCGPSPLPATRQVSFAELAGCS